MGLAGVIKDGYRPSDNEPFMNERQRDYFRRKLVDWKEGILRESRETLAALQSESENHPDIADRASSETDRAIELRARDRQRKLIAKIESALDGSTKAPTAIARRPASRFPFASRRPPESPPFRWRRRSATSGASESIATIDAPRGATRQPNPARLSRVTACRGR